MKTIIYKQTNDCEIKGDFYPTEESNAPLIIYIHGGGLIWGERKAIIQEQVTLYNKAGYNVLSIDYRLAPETKLPKIAEDIQDALKWLQEEGNQQLNFNAEKIAVIGSSAGGYLSLLSGTFSLKPKAIISFYGYGNITGDWYTKPSPYFTKMTKVPEMLVKQLIQNKAISASPIEKRYGIYLYCRQQGKWNDYVTGMNPAIHQDKLKQYCPVYNVDTDYPPTMLLHGNKDKDVPYEESVKMAEALQAKEVPHQILTIPGGEHVFDEHMQDDTVKDAFQQVIAFLNKYV